MGKLIAELKRIQEAELTNKQEVERRMDEIRKDAEAAKATAASLQAAMAEVRAGINVPTTSRSAVAIVVVGVGPLRQYLNIALFADPAEVITELLRKGKEECADTHSTANNRYTVHTSNRSKQSAAKQKVPTTAAANQSGAWSK